MRSNPQLIRKAAKGNPAAISQLYQEHHQAVYRFIYYKVGSSQDAEDLTQDVFMAAFAGLARFRGEASFRNWCYEIAKRKIADLWREKYKLPTLDIEAALGIHTVIETAEDRAEQAANDRHSIGLVQQVFDQLKDNYRQVLEYRFLKNYTIKETAAAMDISISNAKILQHRAIKKAAALGIHLDKPL